MCACNLTVRHRHSKSLSYRRAPRCLRPASRNGKHWIAHSRLEPNCFQRMYVCQVHMQLPRHTCRTWLVANRWTVSCMFPSTWAKLQAANSSQLCLELVHFRFSRQSIQVLPFLSLLDRIRASYFQLVLVLPPVQIHLENGTCLVPPHRSQKHPFGLEVQDVFTRAAFQRMHLVLVSWEEVSGHPSKFRKVSGTPTVVHFFTASLPTRITVIRGHASRMSRPSAAITILVGYHL